MKLYWNIRKEMLCLKRVVKEPGYIFYDVRKIKEYESEIRGFESKWEMVGYRIGGSFTLADVGSFDDSGFADDGMVDFMYEVKCENDLESMKTSLRGLATEHGCEQYW